jgi:uncharacterized membrane protein
MSRIVKIVILSVVAALLIILLVFGIAAQNVIYFSAGRMMFGEQTGQVEGTAVSEFEADAGEIRNIRLDFVSESIKVVVTDEDTIRIEEKSSRELSKDAVMVAGVSGDTLSAVSGLKNKWMGLFNLVDTGYIEVTLYVPADYQGNMGLYSSSGEIRVEQAKADTLRLSSVSGALYVGGAAAETFELDTTSGEIAVKGGSYGRVNADSVSGEILLQADRMESVQADTTSGSVVVEAGGMPQKIDVNTVSGSVDLLLPDNDGFTLDFDSVSGSLSNNFEMVNNVHGNGDVTVSVDTVSGSLDITKR